MMLQLLKVSGYSLYPAYQDGDFVWVSSIPILFRGIRPGDVIVFSYPRLGNLIKFVERLEDGGRRLRVVGLDADSVDSRALGDIPRAQVLGKVIGSISVGV